MPIFDVNAAGSATQIGIIHDVNAAGSALQINKVDDINASGSANAVYTSELVLYDRGTFHPLFGDFTNISGGVAGSTSTASNRLHVGANADTWGNRTGASALAFNCTPYKTLRVVCTTSGAASSTGNSALFALSATRTRDDNLYNPKKGWVKNPGGTQTTYNQDISGHTGNYFFIARAYNWSSTAVWIRVYEVRLIA